MEDKKAESGSYLILIASLAFILICILFNKPLYFGFAGAVAFTVTVLIKKGYDIRTLNGMMLNGVKGCSRLIIIILLTGITVSIWLSSGIVPTLIYYGLEYIKHTNFLLVCFAASAAVAVVMGTSIGTISTIGIALLGIGKGFEIPVHMVLGAVVSGAFFADRTSPISGIVNLTLKTMDLKYRNYMAGLLRTLIPSAAIAAAVYYFLGKGCISVINSERIAEFQHNISSSFVVNPLILLIPLIVIILSVCGIDPIINMSLGIAGSSIISVFLQKNAVPEIVQYMISGYHPAKGIGELNEVLRGGGMLSMFELLLILAGAVALNSLLEGAKIISPIIEGAVKKVKNKVSLIYRTAALSSLFTIVTCDQVLGIIVLGRLLQNKFEASGISKVKLARTIADSGTAIAPLIPWNVNAIIILAITGIPTGQYAPYALMCYLPPVMTLLSSLFKEKP
ncbi:MAG TPA: Na+/H+ antiporter NhaC family protein [Bacillota bacterium]|jgi:NhaC family Na+:H+ antiporter|nr:Na+/H+ antiporter NhaC family protein [Bacillota bacterium]